MKQLKIIHVTNKPIVNNVIDLMPHLIKKAFKPKKQPSTSCKKAENIDWDFTRGF